MTPATLNDRIARAERALDADQLAGNHRAAEAQAEHLATLYELQSAAHERAERAESEGPRYRAEVRLAHHIEHDTLDLY